MKSRRTSVKRAQKTGHIWSLPEEVLIHVFRGLHMRDLLSLRSTCRYIRGLIDNNCCLWISAHFNDTWPLDSNIEHFERAANLGNTEAMLKLAIAYLYLEGLTGDTTGQHTEANGYMAAEFFIQAEMLTQNELPVTWLFIRPPWGSSGVKECVLRNMKFYTDIDPDPAVCLSIAKTLQHSDDLTNLSEGKTILQMAAHSGSLEAALVLWKDQVKGLIRDTSQELNNVRELRHIARSGHNHAQLELCKMYARGRYGGIQSHQAALYVKSFIQRSKTIDLKVNSTDTVTSSSMRYILVDWLVEVACEKGFSNETLHTAVNIVDRYMMSRGVCFSRLQLLGVSALAIASRLFEENIMAIREAAWLTGNTFVYEDVVRMIGEITAALKGNFRTFVTLDYVNLVSLLANDDVVTQQVAEYLCELSLLHSTFCKIPQGKVAAACIVLTRLITKQQSTWPSHLEQWTGFSLSDLTPIVFKLHNKSFDAPSVTDHRDVTLKSVKEKYAEEQFHNVSQLPVPSRKKICESFKVNVISGPVGNLQDAINKEIITSPKRGTACDYSAESTVSEISS